MTRAQRTSDGGFIYHALNRANAREHIFRAEGDYAAFEELLTLGCERVRMRILAYALMPSHWHLVLWPYEDGDLSKFVGWVSLTHAKRWQTCHGQVGWGHIYQGRFKSFPVQSDTHFHVLCRYVERNPVRARLVRRAEDWRWGSLWRRTTGEAKNRLRLSSWPIPIPKNWLDLVNEAQPDSDVQRIRACVQRGRPFGTPPWQAKTAAALHLQASLRPRGRPTKSATG